MEASHLTPIGLDEDGFPDVYGDAVWMNIATSQVDCDVCGLIEAYGPAGVAAHAQTHILLERQ